MMDEPVQSIVESALFLEKNFFNLHNIPIAEATSLLTIVKIEVNETDSF